MPLPRTFRRVVVADDRGYVHLDLPLGAPGAKHAVELSWRTLEEEDPEARRRKRAELEALAGSFADLPLERPPQPPLDAAPEL